MKTPQQIQAQAEEMAEKLAYELAQFSYNNVGFGFFETKQKFKESILSELNLVDLITERDELKSKLEEEISKNEAEYSKLLQSQIDTLKKQKEELVKAAKALADKLEVIHNDPLYLSVWTMYQIHGGDYSNGPKYVKELETLRSTITSAMKGIK